MADLIGLAVVFLILALIAYILGARGIAGFSMTIAKWLVIIFVILAIISLILWRYPALQLCCKGVNGIKQFYVHGSFFTLNDKKAVETEFFVIWCNIRHLYCTIFYYFSSFLSLNSFVFYRQTYFLNLNRWAQRIHNLYFILWSETMVILKSYLFNIVNF